jgi:hypothetical protein
MCCCMSHVEPTLARISGEVLRPYLREREELLAELVPAMKARGYETAAVRSVVGG